MLVDDSQTFISHDRNLHDKLGEVSQWKKFQLLFAGFGFTWSFVDVYGVFVTKHFDEVVRQLNCDFGKLLGNQAELMRFW
jgi:hypothetical protein